jgi:AcrR family transcriptional regulator
MSDLVRPYRGVSAVERIEGRRARFLVAALDVVGRVGVTAATVDAVCAEAGLTKRYFYESFKNLDGLLEAVLENLHTSLLDDIHEQLGDAGDDPAARARLTITLLLAVMDDPRNRRLYVEAAGHPGLLGRRQAAYDVYAKLITEDVLRLNDPGPADHLRALVFVTGTTQAVIHWLQGSVELEREELIDELVKVALA